MNNDNQTTASVVVGCSSITTPATKNGTGAVDGSGSGSGGTATAAAVAGEAVNANDMKLTLSTVAGHSTTTISTTSPSIYTSASAAKSTAVPISGQNDDNANRTETLEESRLKDWDYCRFKQLLEEAYSYKNPRDKENKSKIFLDLLKKVENEKEDQKSGLTSRYTPRNSSSKSQKQGGSLQDLVEAERNESLDCDYNYGGARNRRHNHNSRPKKYSSVSSRQREGGSLPSNVNVSNCSLSIYEEPFMSEEKSKIKRNKNEPRIVSNTTSTTVCLAAGGRTSPVTIGSSCTITGGSTTGITTEGCGVVSVDTAPSINVCSGKIKNDLAIASGCGSACEGAVGLVSLAASIGSATSATCAALASAKAVVSDSVNTVNDMSENYADPHNDLLSQGIQFDHLDGIEMKIPRANIIGSVLTRSDFSPNNTTCYVDEAVHFTTLERGKSTVDASYIPLDENYKACKSVLGEKSELVKMQSFSATKTISKQFDENGNSLNTTYTASQSQAKAKKKKPQSERNTKTLDVQSVEGYRGFYPIEELVKYIESSEDAKQTEKVSKFSDNNKRKEKKKDKEKEKEKEKEKSKIKRSNSLEELRSCSKLDGDDVTLRNKSHTKNKSIENKEKHVLAAGNSGTNRKGERRSWGTEELTYLGENNTLEEVREKTKDKEKRKSKEKDKDFSEKLEKVVEKRKKSDVNIVLSMESISCESAEFHVVTKKKKPKKQKQLSEDSKNNVSGNIHKTPIYQNRKYYSNFNNDRDTYITSFNNNNTNDKSRRKSTSSMPPSEKSDSSDLDSVHSLPIESAGGRSPLQVHHHQNQPRSYAEIARKTDTNEVSPVSGAAAAIETTTSNNSSNNSSNTELEIKTNFVSSVNSVTKKSKKPIKTDFPELISNDGGGTSCSSTTSSSSTIIKQISYSQSLTSAAVSKPDDVAIDNVLQKLTPIDVTKITDKHQKAQQQFLQKSKSVEAENFYNSIDQYPALEKTVKRHSTVNACGLSEVVVMTTTPPNTGQIQMNNATNVGCISIGNTIPTGKKSKNNTKANEEVLEEQQTYQTTKKSKKEKPVENIVCITPPSTQTQTQLQTQTQTQLQTQTQTQLSSSSITSFPAPNINSKNQINLIHHNYNFNNNNNNHKSSCSNNSHNNNTNTNANNSSNNSSSNKFSNRPAVIILNDDTTAGGLSSGIGNEFTFGDFNEEELRLFDDSQPQVREQDPFSVPPPQSDVSQKRYSDTRISSVQGFDDSGGNFNTTMCSNVSDVNNSDDTMLLMHLTSSPNSSLVVDQSSDSGIYNNYDGLKGKRKNQPSVSTTILDARRSSSTDAVANKNIVNSSASTSPSKESLSSTSSSASSTSSSNSSASSSSSSTYAESIPPALFSTSLASSTAGKTSKTTKILSSPRCIQQNPQNQLDSNKNKTVSENNTRVLTNNKRNSQQQQQQQQEQQQQQHTSSDNCTDTSLPSQFETCNNIETAIIAAAKKDAAVAAEQTTSVINKNFTAENFNNSTPPMGSATITQLNNINNNSTANHLNSYRQQRITSLQSSVVSSIQSSGKEYSRKGGSGGTLGQQQRKEIDVHFIPPALATPISSIQNNETIINFIGSAWEEVANSKVTQFYDGQ